MHGGWNKSTQVLEGFTTNGNTSNLVKLKIYLQKIRRQKCIMLIQPIRPFNKLSSYFVMADLKITLVILCVKLDTVNESFCQVTTTFSKSLEKSLICEMILLFPLCICSSLCLCLSLFFKGLSSLVACVVVSYNCSVMQLQFSTFFVWTEVMVKFISWTTKLHWIKD